MKPIDIRRINNNIIVIEWDDGFKSSIKQNVLRRDCPCASCREEISNNSSNKNFISLDTFTTGKNTLKELKPVGNYALQAIWADGHDTGIYTWDLLREICEHNNITDKHDTCAFKEFDNNYIDKNKIPGNNTPK